MQKLPRFGPKGNSYDSASESQAIDKLQEFLSRHKKTKKSIGISLGNCVEIIEDKSGIKSSFGYTINSKLYIFPEEALFLIGKGTLEIDVNHENFVKDSGVDIEKYWIYGFLRREGVVLKRDKDSMRSLLSNSNTNGDFLIQKSGQTLSIKKPVEKLQVSDKIVVISDLSNPSLLRIEEFEP